MTLKGQMQQMLLENILNCFPGYCPLMKDGDICNDTWEIQDLSGEPIAQQKDGQSLKDFLIDFLSQKVEEEEGDPYPEYSTCIAIEHANFQAKTKPMSLWKSFFEASPAEYKWGTIDASTGFIWLYSKKPMLDEVGVWTLPGNKDMDAAILVGEIYELSWISKEMSTTIVHRAEFMNQ